MEDEEGERRNGREERREREREGKKEEKKKNRASLGAPWLRVRLPMQGTRV